MCQAIAGIARSLGLGLVAEGVESEAQRQFLLELGVHVGQGFLFAPGLTPSEFERRIAAPQPAALTTTASTPNARSRDRKRATLSMLWERSAGVEKSWNMLSL